MMIRKFEDATAQFVWTWGIVPPNFKNISSRGEQTAIIFRELDRLLLENGMTFANVVRTWFYCDNINDWYAEFNGERTKYFEQHHVFETFLPASTGIGHPNPFGAALTAGFFAMKPKSDWAKAEIVKSPLQADAMSYKSSFSRAAETTSAWGRRLFVSGTASILPNSSEVAYLDDPVRQIDCAMKAALAIVESRGMGEEDVSRVIVYLKHPEYRPFWREWLAKSRISRKVVTEIVAEVCRPEWLFEVELDAVKRV